MGDLKNNFVQLGKDGDKTQYQIEISKDQVPSLVNAGLSLFAYSVAADEGSDWGVYYEDYSASELNAYEKLSGNKLSEDFRNGYLQRGDTADSATYNAWYDKNEKQINEIADFLSEKDWERQYYEAGRHRLREDRRHFRLLQGLQVLRPGQPQDGRG